MLKFNVTVGKNADNDVTPYMEVVRHRFVVPNKKSTIIQWMPYYIRKW